MARVSPMQGDFSAGEFSPNLLGRVDVPRYKAGLGLLQNALPMLQGPVTRRAGTVFIAPTKYSNKFTRLIPFKFSNTQAYMLEFGDQYIRFYTQRGQIVGPYEIASPYLEADLPLLRFTQSLDVLYLVHKNYAPRKLERFGNTDWVLEKIVFKDGPYLNPGLPPNTVTVTSLIHSASLDFSSATGATNISSAAGDYAALAISGIANNGAGLARVQLADPDEFKDRSRIRISGATGTTGANGTWVAKKIDATHYDLVGSVFNAAYTGGATVAPAPFLSTDVGRLIRAQMGAGAWGYVVLTSVNVDGVQAVGTVINTLTTATSTKKFRFGTYSDSDGYPGCCVFHEDRLFLGGSGGALQRIDGSEVSNYESFAPTQLDASATPTIVATNAVSFSLTSNDANVVRGMTSDERGLPVITSGGPWIVKPSVLNEAITPTNISAKRISNVGSAEVSPIQAGKATIYLETSTRKVRELTYFYDIDGFRAIDLTEIAEHLPGKGIVTEIVYQSIPQPIIWCGRADGTFIGITYDRNLQNLRSGWHRHYLGGVSDTSGTPPVIKSLSVIPSPDATTDDVWVIVKRYINGATVQYVEYISKIYEQFNIQQDAFFVDCGATLDNPLAVSNITGTATVIITHVAHGLATGDKVRFQDVVGLENSSGEDRINKIPFTVSVIDADHFSLDGLDATGFTPYVAGTGVFRKQVHLITGLTWLENAEVSILADGAVLPNGTVSAGGVLDISPNYGGVIQIGISYSSRIQLLPFESGAQDGTAIGKRRRINEASFMLNNCGSCKIGMNFDPDHQNELIIRQTGDSLDEAPPLFSGIKDQVQIESDYNLYNQIALEITDPTPFTLLAVMPQQVVYDKS